MGMDSRQQQILDALRVFIPEGQITELRAFNGRDDKAIESTLYRDLEAMAARAVHLEDKTDASGIYFVLNPANEDELKPGAKCRKGSLSAKKIARRRWMPIDVDPARFNENGEVLEGDAARLSSTNEEHDAAWAVISECRQLLDSMNFVGAVLGDSGNGWHLCYPVDLPNDQATYDMVAAILDGLEVRCGTNLAHVDPKPKDAPRIWKLYGTLARKGAPSDERPHRRSWLAEGQAPTQEQREANNAALERLLDIWRDQDGPAVRRSPSPQTTLPRAATVGRARAYLAEEKIAIQGQQGTGSKACYHVACILTWGFALSDSEAFDAIRDWNAQCQPPWPDHQLQHKFDDARKATNHAEPYGYLRDAKREPDAKSGVHSGNGKISGSESKTTPAWRFDLDDIPMREGSPSDVLDGLGDVHHSGTRVFSMRTIGNLRRQQYKPQNWVVPGIMTEGLNILAGAPKQGKSFLALNLAMTVAGGGYALGNVKVAASDVLYLSLEDQERRVQHRLLKMLPTLTPEVEESLDRRLTVVTEWPRMHEGGLRLLDLWCRRVERPGLVIIDVWNRFMPIQQNNSSIYAQDSECFGQIKTFADRRSMAALIIHHTRKLSGSREADDYLQEINGTLGIPGTADGIFVLLRARQETQASLHFTGREVSNQELILEFDVNTFTWKSVGTAAEHVEGRVRQGIVKFLRGLNGESAFAVDIASAIGEKEDSVRRALGRLRAEKIIRKVGNAWSFPGEAGSGDEIGI